MSNITYWNKKGFTANSTFCFYSFSVQFSRSVVSNSLWPHGLQHARLLCPSLSSEVCSDSCPLSWWCYLTISPSATPFSFCLQSFPASGSFPMKWLFAIVAKILELQHQFFQRIFRVDFPLGLTGLISLLFKEFSRVFSNTSVGRHQFFSPQSSLWSNSHIINGKKP